MNKNQKKKLEAIILKYESSQDDDSVMMSQTAFAISADKGVWMTTRDGKPFKLSWHSLDGSRRSSSNVIFYYDSVEDRLVGIKRFKNGKLFAFNDCDFQCQITDPDLIAIIEELAHL